MTPCLLLYALLLQREPPLRGELDFQNQVRDHAAADESDRPDKLLQQRLTSVNGIRRGFESPVVAGVHLAAQLLKAGMTYQARKARMARTFWPSVPSVSVPASLAGACAQTALLGRVRLAVWSGLPVPRT